MDLNEIVSPGADTGGFPKGGRGGGVPSNCYLLNRGSSILFLFMEFGGSPKGGRGESGPQDPPPCLSSPCNSSLL